MNSKCLYSTLVRNLGARSYTTSLDTCTAGAIRAAGGAFGRLEAAKEDEYFLRKQFEQINKLKDNQITQEKYHLKAIRELEVALMRHKEALKKIRI